MPTVSIDVTYQDWEEEWVHAESQYAEDEVSHVVGQLHVKHNEPDWLVEYAHVPHDRDQMNALEHHLGGVEKKPVWVTKYEYSLPKLS